MGGELDLGEAHSREQTLQQNRHIPEAYVLIGSIRSMPNSSSRMVLAELALSHLTNFSLCCPLGYLKSSKMHVTLLCNVLPLHYLLGFLGISQFVVAIVQALLQLRTEILFLLLHLHGCTSCQFPLSVPLSIPLPFQLPKSLQGTKRHMKCENRSIGRATPGSQFWHLTN